MSSFVAEKLAAFDAPGYPHLDDGLNPAQKLSWSDKISKWITGEINAVDENGKPLEGPVVNGVQTYRTVLTQFFNGTATPYDLKQKPTSITWFGFPKRVKEKYKTAPLRWQIADSSRAYQDEYLEWSLKRDENGNITTVTFTCEGPEYWQFLGDEWAAEKKLDKMHKLYQKLNPDFADQIKEYELFTVAGSYFPNNNWNSTTTSGTIAHLVHPSNTLSAEIDIAAQATVIRKDKKGKIITDRTQLINCSRYGQPLRDSDPKIGDGINGKARQGVHLSLANPVALYMSEFNTQPFMLDVNGTGEGMIPVPPETFNFQRGSIENNQGLRLQIKIPQGVVGTGPENKGRQLTVGDICDTATNQYIKYGAQFADYITMTVRAVAIDGDKAAEPLACPGQEIKNLAALAAVEGEEGVCEAGMCDVTKDTDSTPRPGTRW